MEEIWNPAIGYEAILEVSNIGNVRYLNSSGHLKYTKHHNGHLYIQFEKNGVRHRLYIHTLVARAFIGNPMDKVVVHLNGNKLDNHYKNLEWMTQSEMVLYNIHNLGSFDGYDHYGEKSQLSKTYSVTSPEGKEYTVKGLNAFCKEHNIHSSGLFAVANGRREHHKGWKCKHITD